MKIGEKNKTIGVIGGMGPDASVHMLRRIIELSRDEFGVENTNQYPEILLKSLVVDDFVENTTTVSGAIKEILKTTDQFRKLKVDCFGIACNTAHIVLQQNKVTMPDTFISMVDEVVEEIMRQDLKTVGLMGSPVTITSGFFQSALQQVGIKTLVPSKKEIEGMGKAIIEILGGNKKGVKKELLSIADSLLFKGAESVVLACTELPLVFSDDTKIPTIDTMDVLAKALLKRYYSN